MSSILQWITNIPDSWEVKPLKSIASYWVSNVDKVPNDEEEPVKLCNYSDVYNNDYITLDLEFMRTTATRGEISKFGLQVGDIIITKDSESWDDIAIPALVIETDQNLVCGYHLAMVRPESSIIHSPFLFWCFQSKSLRVQLELASTGVTRFGLPKGEIGNFVLPIPPLPTQRLIAAYLNRETARIDALIAAKERLLALLAEKRQALITRAVTRGLDENVKMRDSGVAWLGEVPEGWEVVKLKTIASYSISNVDKVAIENEEPVLLCNYSDVYNNDYITLEIDFMRTTATKTEISKFGLKVGDILITKDSESWEDIAVPALIVETNEKLVCGYHLAMIRPNPTRINSHFLFHCFQSKTLRVQLELAATGVTRYGLPKGEIGNFIIPLPDLKSQEAIITHIQTHTARTDAIRTAAERSIDLLRERRSALIAAAVTGRVEVERAS